MPPVESIAAETDIRAWVIQQARKEGFDKVGIADANSAPDWAKGLSAYIEAGFHGDMAWLAGNLDRRADPRSLWPEVRSIIMLGLNYGPAIDPLTALSEPTRGVISAYAQGADYHDVIKSKLKAIAGELARRRV